MAGRAVTKRGSPVGHLALRQSNEIQRLVDSFSKVKTQPMTAEEFDQTVRLHAGTSVAGLKASERERLFTCLDRFYRCYSSGGFQAYKEFRLRPPFTLGERVASAMRKIATKQGLIVESGEDLLRLDWDKCNGTNRIGEVSAQSIVLSVAERKDLGWDLRQPSGTALPGLGGASCWEGAVVYQPSPEDLLKQDGTLRLFRLEVTVRYSPFTTGPATPLVLLGYWDKTREDWMPLVMCTRFHVGGYSTVF